MHSLKCMQAMYANDSARCAAHGTREIVFRKKIIINSIFENVIYKRQKDIYNIYIWFIKFMQVMYANDSARCAAHSGTREIVFRKNINNSIFENVK